MLNEDSSHRFTNVTTVIANVSIVNAVDRISGTHCDINTSTRMGVLNSRFIKFCTDFDPRVRSLHILVKTFSKQHSLSGSGRGDHLSNYSIVLMVITFLQIQGILHPLKILQDVPSLEPVLINGYIFAFCSDLSLIPNLLPNECSILELLLCFFEYFSEFAFDSFVICPSAGEPRKKVEMNPPKPPVFVPRVWNYQSMANVQRPLVIQDPFELGRNTAINVNQKRLSRVVHTFGAAAQVLRSLVDSDEVQEGSIEMIFDPDFLPFKNKSASDQTYCQTKLGTNFLRTGQSERSSTLTRERKRIAIIDPTTRQEVSVDCRSSDKKVGT